jgi:hypothetical protein
MLLPTLMPVCMPVTVSLCVAAHARLDTGCAYVPMPMRHSVVTDTHMHGTGGQIRRNKRLADDVSLPELAAKTKNYSGAEIQGARTRIRTRTRTHTQMNTYAHTHTHTHMNAYTQAHTHECMHAHTHRHTHTDMNAYTQAHTHECIHAHTHENTHTYTHECIHTSTHTQRHTHTHRHTHTSVKVVGPTLCVRFCASSFVPVCVCVPVSLCLTGLTRLSLARVRTQALFATPPPMHSTSTLTRARVSKLRTRSPTSR